MDPVVYLQSTDIIDWKTETIGALAQKLVPTRNDPSETAQVCFEWVRDNIAHSGDIQSELVTCCASEVLKKKTGWCFAKNHLLAALLRANNIPAGFCYQRLSRDDASGFTLHGLNAVFLQNVGWYRVDPRGNKPGVNAQFNPPAEQLAWLVTKPGELDLPEIWPEPLPIVVQYLQNSHSLADAKNNLPDIEIVRSPPGKTIIGG